MISPDLFDRIEQDDLSGQSPADFSLKSRVKDEIALAWADAQDLWRIFQHRLERLDASATATSETRRFWMIPFLALLGYETETARARNVNGQSYAISHHAANRDGYPIHLMGVRDQLDRRRNEGGPRLSPHALLQEFLNLDDHLFGMVSNGLQLRLLRDSSRLVKLSFLEFDLERIMNEDLFADFALLFRLLHVSRMPVASDAGAESLIEQYHQDSLEAGSRIRDQLRNAFRNSILDLANGFLRHPANQELRQVVTDQSFTARDFYSCLLRLMYRMLFLMVIEERHLVFKSGTDERLIRIYDQGYSLFRLRRLAEKRFLADGRYHDLWIGLRQTFQLFLDTGTGEKIGILPLNGELFGEQALGPLEQAHLDNQVLLTCIRHLNLFEHPETGQPIRVNYAALNVEEFGSVYEGLLESEPRLVPEGSRWRFELIKGSERGATGSHYTPDELVKPLIEHSLEHILKEKLKHETKKECEKALLDITVCDVACGSGHILLNAARRIATTLARVRTGEDQPSPQPYRQALRDVIRHCIYGVDKNPLAVELCKVSLWLESHNPGEPLSFLDHRIRCGDAIVGLAHWQELEQGIPDEAFAARDADDKAVASALKKQNKAERKDRSSYKEYTAIMNKGIRNLAAEFQKLDAMPDHTPQDIVAKQQAYEQLTSGKAYWKMKTLADIQTAQFFVPKKDRKHAVTDGQFQLYLAGEHPTGVAVGKALAVAQQERFFHWFLEFPGVAGRGGFDCVLGNPPFLGNRKIKSTFGARYLNWLQIYYAPAGAVELVAYFFRRIFSLIRSGGYQSLIATNTVAQGDAREGGLAVILKQGGIINHAVRSMRWPGAAAVEVALVTIVKGKWDAECVLDRKPVAFISSYLDDSEALGDPFPLQQNANKSFQGSIVLGQGFVLTPQEAEALIAKNPKNRNVLYPYLNGDDLNSRPDQSPSRWVINFHDWPLDREWDEQQKIPKGPPYAADYPDCLAIVERLVKPERSRWKRDRAGKELVGQYTLRNPLPHRWWHYADKRPKLYRTIAPLERVIVTVRISKYTSFVFLNNGIIFNDKCIVTSLEHCYNFTILQSSMNDAWAWKNSGTLGGGTIIYSPTNCFETFPIPQNLSEITLEKLEILGQTYYEHRQQLMLALQIGLTKTYNLFHRRDLKIEDVERVSKQPADIAESGFWDILKLRDLHREMDLAVRDAYGWSDLDLEHGFHEVSYLPENDRIRYTISELARKEVLKRLLLLNHEIHEKEVNAKEREEQMGLGL
ncbi:N-6 DNA methylase [candidate division KSB1 bacterium]|nr:N-6 DNA methylase [candidate division KSB1 bacterium]